VEVVLRVSGRPLHETFGSPDDFKFRSSVTLFAVASGDDTLFRQAIDRYCDGVRDLAMIEMLGIQQSH
jgi:uncharacterized protein (DUF1810 family)